MSAAGPEIVVLIAPVHDCLNPVKIEPGGKKIDPSSFRWILNPYDAFALEQALRIRDVIPGTRVRVMAMASSDSEQVVRGCLAVGADEAVRIWDDRMEGSDSYATARVLAAALGKQSFDLVLCGWRRADLEHGQVGPALAEILDLPQVTGARKIESADNNTRILVDKRVPGYLTKLVLPIACPRHDGKGAGPALSEPCRQTEGGKGRDPLPGTRHCRTPRRECGSLRLDHETGALHPAEAHEKERHGLDGGKDDGRGTPSEDHGWRRSGEEGQQDLGMPGRAFGQEGGGTYREREVDYLLILLD